MPATVRDVLKINIVFVGLSLLNEPSEVREFSDAVGADVAQAEPGVPFGFPPGIPVPLKNLALQRDRISIHLVPDRTIIEREFPAEGDLERLAEVTNKALHHTVSEGVLRAFGYNLELVYEQSSGSAALQYIGKRLFREDPLAPEGWALYGGSGSVLFNSPVGRWTVRLEPRLNEEASTRVFLNMNLHKAEPRVPDREEILQTFRDVWTQAHNFVQLLDEGGE